MNESINRHRHRPVLVSVVVLVAVVLFGLIFVGISTASIESPVCKADFTYTINSNLVHFMDNSTGSIVSYIWDFGDNSGSNEQNPVHIYAKPGKYFVTLVVMNAYSNYSAVTKSIEITSVAETNNNEFPLDIAGNAIIFTSTSCFIIGAISLILALPQVDAIIRRMPILSIVRPNFRILIGILFILLGLYLGGYIEVS